MTPLTSGLRHPYLESRNGIWTLRVRVPPDVQLRVGLREFRRSLRTDSSRKAQQLAAHHVARLQELFEVARKQELGDDQIKLFARRTFAELDARLPRPPRDCEIPEFWRSEQIGFAEEQVASLNEQAKARWFETAITESLLSALGASGMCPGDLTPDSLDDAYDAVLKAHIEGLQRYMHRLQTPLVDYQPSDPLFCLSAEAVLELTATPTSSGFGPTVGGLIDQYLAAKSQMLVGKTLANRRQKLSLFAEHVGADRRISEITAQDMRTFCEGLQRMRRAHHTGADTSFQGRQTSDPKSRVSAKTALLHANDVKSMFRWAHKHGYCENPPLAGLVVELPKQIKGIKSRRPFSPGEVEQLFGSPAFTGCRGARRRFDAGACHIHDAYFWIPILGYYTGARLSELVQLHLGDVPLEGAISHLNFNEEVRPGEGSSKKHLKSDAAVRLVPLHDDVLTLGFEKFVRRRMADPRAKASGRLFFEVRFGADGQAGTVFSKWFARLMDRVGLDDRSLVFHSFRHTAEDAFRNALQPPYVINRIIGHEGGHVSDAYGQGVSLEVAQKAVNAMALPRSLPKILGFPDKAVKYPA